MRTIQAAAARITSERYENASGPRAMDVLTLHQLDTPNDAETRSPLPMVFRHLCFACAMLPTAVLAGISQRNSYVRLTPDGTTLLVMLSDWRETDMTPAAILPDGTVADLRKTFGKSRAYDPVTLAPRWQVDWYSLDRELLCSSDGMHVARFNGWGYTEGWALQCYDRGRLVHRYARKQLLTGLASCMAGDDEPWYGGAQLTPNGDGVRLSTPHRRLLLGDRFIDLGLQEFYTFDLSTGSMLSREVVGKWKIWEYAALPLPPLFALVILVRWLRRRLKSHAKRGFPPICIVRAREADGMEAAVSSAMSAEMGR